MGNTLSTVNSSVVASNDKSTSSTNKIHINIPTPIIISDNHIKKLEQVINELESEYGAMFEISIRQYGHNDDKKTIIKPIINRGPVRVHSMRYNYKELEGEYNTLDDVNKKVKKLSFDELSKNFMKNYKLDDSNNSNKKKVMKWQCKECNHIHKPFDNQKYVYIGNLCQGCHIRLTDKWEDVVVYEHKIFKGDGGSSVCILDPIGFVTFC